MIISIGDIVNELVKYSNKVEAQYIGSTPVLKAFLSQSNCLTRAYLYVAQVSDTKYTAYADVFDNCGYGFLPTGMSEFPFIREIEQIKNMVGGSLDVDERYSRSIKDADYPELIDFIYETLVSYKIVAAGKTLLNSKISSLITNPKLVRSIDRSFVANGKRDGTVHDMYDIVVRDRKKFVLNEVKTKDRKLLTQKLADRGIGITITGDKITDVTFKRK